MTQDHQPSRQRAVPTFTIERARCSCGSTRLAVRRSTPQGDGSQLRYYECRDCGLHFRVIVV